MLLAFITNLHFAIVALTILVGLMAGALLAQRAWERKKKVDRIQERIIELGQLLAKYGFVLVVDVTQKLGSGNLSEALDAMIDICKKINDPHSGVEFLFSHFLNMLKAFMSDPDKAMKIQEAIDTFNAAAMKAAQKRMAPPAPTA
jgi:hypothetical protein